MDNLLELKKNRIEQIIQNLYAELDSSESDIFNEAVRQIVFDLLKKIDELNYNAMAVRSILFTIISAFGIKVYWSNNKTELCVEIDSKKDERHRIIYEILEKNYMFLNKTVSDEKNNKKFRLILDNIEYEFKNNS